VFNARKRRANASICTGLGTPGAGALKHRKNGDFNAISGSSGGNHRKAAGSVTRCVFGALRFASRLSWVNRGAAPERRMA